MQLQPFLTDPDARSAAHRGRRASPSTCPTATRPRCWLRSSDEHVEVRRVAADGIRELVEVLPDRGAPSKRSSTPPIPSCAGPPSTSLSSRRVGDAEQFRRALADHDHRVRIEAVRALVSVDDADGVAAGRVTTTAKSASRSPTGWARCARVPRRCAD